MDGLDGLVAGCMAVVIASLSVSLHLNWMILILLGSLLCFLVFNWSPSQVFMGDVGSTFLGAMYAGFVLQASSWIEALGFLLLSTPLLGDSFTCVVRRFFAGHRIFQAHRLHLFQRLYQAGWPHARVSLVYIFATSALTVALHFGGFPWLFGLALFEIIFGFFLDKFIAVPFSFASDS